MSGLRAASRPWGRFRQHPGWWLSVAGALAAVTGVAVLQRTRFDVRALYRFAARYYDSIAPLWRDWLYRDAYCAYRCALARYLPPDGKVLDLGCGTGANLEELLALRLPFGPYTGVDLSEAMLARARTKLGGVPNARFKRMDLLTGPWPEGPFDLVVSTWVFEHLPDPMQVVETAWQRLGPGGHMVLLFEVQTQSWRDRCFAPLGRLFSAHLLREDQYLRFPGRLSIERFSALGPTVVVLVLGK
jgi:SAM-dependent methyltransferase